MAKINQNFIHYKGDEKVITITVEDALLLTGFTIKWSMSETANSSKLITKSTAATPATVTIEANTASLTLAAADTDYASSIVAGTYYHEWRIWDADSKPVVVATGSIELKDVINRT